MIRRCLILAAALAMAHTGGADAQRRLPRQPAPSVQDTGLRGSETQTAEDGTTASSSAANPVLAAPTSAGATQADLTATPAPAVSNPDLAAFGDPNAPATSAAPAAPAQAFQVADDCRQACASSYYFCLAGADATECPPDWAQCLTECRDPSRPTANP